jgi:hypothetical protein
MNDAVTNVRWIEWFAQAVLKYQPRHPTAKKFLEEDCYLWAIGNVLVLAGLLRVRGFRAGTTTPLPLERSWAVRPRMYPTGARQIPISRQREFGLVLRRSSVPCLP